jgi:hypothetical protein
MYCKWCTLWRSTRICQRCGTTVLSKRHAVLRCRVTCNSIYTCTESAAFPLLIITKTVHSTSNFVQLSYAAVTRVGKQNWKYGWKFIYVPEKKIWILQRRFSSNSQSFTNCLDTPSTALIEIGGKMYKIRLNFICDFTAGTLTKLTPSTQHYLEMIFYTASHQNHSTNLESTGWNSCRPSRKV